MEKLHVCPWYIGYFLLNPMRKWMQGHDEILGDYVQPGMQVIDYGSAMGYFSLPMAKMVGPAGKVFCYDIQEVMLRKLSKRAGRSGLENIIFPRLVNGVEGPVFPENSAADFALLFAVAHEVPDKAGLFRFLAGSLKRSGLLLFAEPTGHVSSVEFENSLDLAEQAGLRKVKSLNIQRSHAALLQKTP